MNSIHSSATRPVVTTAEQRRRRHLSVYHRALRSAETPEQRAAVVARYRKLFAFNPESPAGVATQIDLTEPKLAETIQLRAVQASPVRLAS